MSIVTPTHNDGATLAECIESVLAQTYSNWEYTIVNNCSTDGTLEIARRYAQRDSRIRVVDNTRFLRAVANHNEALRQISPQSKYCKMVFGDDLIFPQCLEKMVGLADSYPAVGIVSAYMIEGEKVLCSGLPLNTPVLTGIETCRRHFMDKLYLFGSATTLMYRSDLVRARPSFLNESNVHADTEVCFDLLRECDFGFVHQVLTFSRLREESINSKLGHLCSDYPAMLHILATYGPDYLTRDELSALLRAHLREYYQFLGKSAIRLRGPEFWRFHREKMKASGYRLNPFRLARGMYAAISHFIYA